MTPPLILASSSPRRRELLTSLGVEFTIIKPEIDEAQRNREDPIAYVQRLSREKTQAVAAQLNAPATIIAADTVVILAADTIGIDEEGDILGKPVDADEARDMLQRLRGRPHTVVTSVTVLKVQTPPPNPLPIHGEGEQIAFSDLARTTVHMREYSDDEIEAYIATGDPFDKAGSYAIQHEGFHPVERIEGDYTNVVGLPLELVRGLLTQAGLLT